MSDYVMRMPDLGEGIAEVEIVAWRVQPGQAVEEDQILADVMTDKATIELPSPVAGRVIALGGEEGQVLAVGAELIRIDTGTAAGTVPSASAKIAAPAEAVTEGTGPLPDPSTAQVVTDAASASEGSAPARAMMPRVPAGAAADAAATTLQATASTAVASATAAAAAAPSQAEGAPDSGTAPAPPVRPIASPAVRARAWELGIDLAEVPATGTAGRIVQADLDAWLAAGGGHRAGAPWAPRPPAAPATPVQALQVTRRPASPAGTDVQPAVASASPQSMVMAEVRPGRVPSADAVQTLKVVGLRRRIAQRMQDAKRRIPHFAYVEEVDVTELEQLRAHLNGRWGAQRPHLTPLAFLVRAIVRAAAQHPEVNATFDDEAGVISRHRAVHLGVAAQTEAGLLVPVMRDAQSLGLWEVASELVRLAALARRGGASRDQLSGSTITVTSLGRLGGIVSTPVINAPEVAIVGVNRIVERPVIRHGAVVARSMMNLSSSFDHRIVDGAHAAAFVQTLRELLEQPATLFVE